MSSLSFKGEIIWAGLEWRCLNIRSGLVNRHLINLGLGLGGPDIRPGLDNRHLNIEGHRGLRRS